MHLPEISRHNESELLSYFREGDREAVSVIYGEFSQRLYHFARRFVDNDAEAEDITSEAFIRLWTKRDDFSSLNAIAVFLHTTVKNRCLDHLKHEKVKLTKRDELIRMLETTPDADFSREALLIALIKKIYLEVDNLPPKMRDIFYLSYKEGLKPSQIAEKLGLSVQTVKNQRVNAIKLLRNSLKDNPLLLALVFQLVCSPNSTF